MDQYDTQELVRLTKENHKMLKGMHRRDQLRSLFGFLKFAVIITLLVLSYIKLQPYLESMLGLYQSVSSASGSFSALGEKAGSFDLEILNNLIN